jgi:hypothetical protein
LIITRSIAIEHLKRLAIIFQELAQSVLRPPKQIQPIQVDLTLFDLRRATQIG